MTIAAAPVRAAWPGSKTPKPGEASPNSTKSSASNSTARLSVTLGLTTWSAPIWDDVRGELEKLLRRREFPRAAVEVAVVGRQRPAEMTAHAGLAAKSVIAELGSGKGGVGKSSVAVFLAAALARAGCRVGLMDADVYGPSIPHLLGTTQRPEIVDGQIEPIRTAGMKILSIGLLVPADEAVICAARCSIASSHSSSRETAWGELDYLLVDMPPGTGDVALSLSQLLPSAGAVVVCTPQDVALLDATKAIAMFRKVDLDLLGMVENMSFFVCPHCGAREDIFGAGGAKRRAAELNVPFLGEVPLFTDLRILADEGRLAEAVDHPAAKPYLAAICHVGPVAGLAENRRRSPRMPTLPVIG